MQPALLLNATYEPLVVVSWKKAITMVLLGKAEVLEAQDALVRSSHREHILPSVLRLLDRVHSPRRAVQFSRVNVYRRDGFRCQYCREALPVGRLTFDHVVPRSRGGETSWENIVTSCGPCNRTKGDRTPVEAGMPLERTPREPRWWPFSMSSWDAEDHPERWRPYMWM